ncbi:MAG: YdcF family protein [Leptospiraceae bacterium]|nr:YdcF family protein [Leptospiraceae bacterium]
MFFYLSKWITLLFSLYPAAYFGCLLLALLAARKTKYRKTRTLFLIGYLLFGFCSTDVCADLLLRPLEETYPTMETTLASHGAADGIIVLGGMMDPVAQRGAIPEFTDGANRLFAGLHLVRANHARAMILSGGSGLILQGGPAEASLLRDWLIAEGLARKDQVIAEVQSRNTAENAINSNRIAQQMGWKRVYLVTSAFHMPRSMAIFKKLTNLELIPICTDYRSSAFFSGPEAVFPSAHGIQKTWIGMKEYLGLLAYWMKGYV